MSDILDKHFTLKLNKYWKAISAPSVYDAIVAMCREHTRFNNGRPYYALDIDYPNINMPPVEWGDWINLPVRPQDNYIQCAKKRIRVPTVIIANNFKGQPKKNVKFSKREVWRRDAGICQWSGEPVNEETGDIDHVLARDLGGKTIFENVVVSKKEINRLKNNMSPQEFQKRFGYKLRRQPFRPKARIIEIINTYGIQDWDLFLK